MQTRLTQIHINQAQQEELQEVLKLGFKVNNGELELPPDEAGIELSSYILDTSMGAKIDLKYNGQIVCQILYKRNIIAIKDKIIGIELEEHKENLKEALDTYKKHHELQEQSVVIVSKEDIGPSLAAVHNAAVSQPSAEQPITGLLTAAGALRALGNQEEKSGDILFNAMGMTTGVRISRASEGKGFTLVLPTDEKTKQQATLALASYQVRQIHKPVEHKDQKQQPKLIKGNLSSPDSVSDKIALLADIDISLDDKANLLAGYAREYQDKYNAKHREAIEKDAKRRMRVRFWRDSGVLMFQVVDGLSDLDPKHQEKLQAEFIRTFAADNALPIGDAVTSDLCNREAPGPILYPFLGGSIGYNPNALQCEQVRTATASRAVVEQHFQKHADEMIDCYQSSVLRVLGSAEVTANLREKPFVTTEAEHKQDIDTLMATNVAYIGNSRIDFGATRDIRGQLELLYRARQIDKALLLNHGNIPAADLLRLKEQLNALDQAYAALKKTADEIAGQEKNVLALQQQEQDTTAIEAKSIEDARRLAAKRDLEWDIRKKEINEQAVKVKSARAEIQKQQQQFFSDYDQVLHALLSVSSLTTEQRETFSKVKHDFDMRTQPRFITCVSESAANTIILSQFEQRPYMRLSWEGVVINPVTKEAEAVATIYNHFPVQTKQKIHYRCDLSGSMMGDYSFKKNAQDELINQYNEVIRFELINGQVVCVNQWGNPIRKPESGPVIEHNRFTFMMDMVDSMTEKNAGKPNRSFSFGVFQGETFNMMCPHVDGMDPAAVESMRKRARECNPEGPTPIVLSLVADEQILLAEAKSPTLTKHKFVYFTDGAAQDPEYAREIKNVPDLLKSHWQPLDPEDVVLFDELCTAFDAYREKLKTQTIKDREQLLRIVMNSEYGRKHRALQQRFLSNGMMYRLGANLLVKPTLEWNVTALTKSIAKNLKHNGIFPSSYEVHMVAIGNTFDESKAEKTPEQELAQAETRAITARLGDTRFNKYIKLATPAEMATARSQLDGSEATVDAATRFCLNPAFNEDHLRSVANADHSQFVACQTNLAAAQTIRMPLSALTKTKGNTAVALLEVKHEDIVYQFTQQVPRTVFENLQELKQDSPVRRKLAETDVNRELLHNAGINLEGSLTQQFKTAADVQRGLEIIKAAKRSAKESKDAAKASYLEELEARFDIVRRGKQYDADKVTIQAALDKLQTELQKIEIEKETKNKELREKDKKAIADDKELSALVVTFSSGTPEFKLAMQRSEEHRDAIQSELKRHDEKKESSAANAETRCRTLIDDLISGIADVSFDVMQEKSKSRYENTTLRRFKQTNRERMFSPYTIAQLDTWIAQSKTGDFTGIPIEEPSTDKLVAMRNALQSRVDKHTAEQQSRVLKEQESPFAYTVEQLDTLIANAEMQAGGRVEFQGEMCSIANLMILRKNPDLIAVVKKDFERFGQDIPKLQQQVLAIWILLDSGKLSLVEQVDLLCVANWLHIICAQCKSYNEGGKLRDPYYVFDTLVMKFLNPLNTAATETYRNNIASVSGPDAKYRFKTNNFSIQEATQKLLVGGLSQLINPEIARQRAEVQQRLDAANAEIEKLRAGASGSPEIARLKISVPALQAECKAIGQGIAALEKREQTLRDEKIVQLNKRIEIEKQDPYVIVGTDVNERDRQVSIDRAAARFALSMGFMSQPVLQQHAEQMPSLVQEHKSPALPLRIRGTVHSDVLGKDISYLTDHVGNYYLETAPGNLIQLTQKSDLLSASGTTAFMRSSPQWPEVFIEPVQGVLQLVKPIMQAPQPLPIRVMSQINIPAAIPVVSPTPQRMASPQAMFQSASAADNEAKQIDAYCTQLTAALIALTKRKQGKISHMWKDGTLHFLNEHQIRAVVTEILTKYRNAICCILRKDGVEQLINDQVNYLKTQSGIKKNLKEGQHDANRQLLFDGLLIPPLQGSIKAVATEQTLSQPPAYDAPPSYA